MMMISNSLSLHMRSEAVSRVQVGDIVRTGENYHPHYRVIAVSEDRAWVRDIQYRTDHIVAIEQCNRIA